MLVLGISGARSKDYTFESRFDNILYIYIIIGEAKRV